MSNEAERPESGQEPEPKPNPAGFYAEQAARLDGQPVLQSLVRERAADLLDADTWGSDPEDMKAGMKEAITYLGRSLENPLSPSLPTILDVSEDDPKDQELSSELIALLQGDPEAFVEGLPQRGPVTPMGEGNSFVESALSIALPGFRLVRSRYLSQALPGNPARYKYYLEVVAPAEQSV